VQSSAKEITAIFGVHSLPNQEWGLNLNISAEADITTFARSFDALRALVSTILVARSIGSPSAIAPDGDA
jgi:hypothetical protein